VKRPTVSRRGFLIGGAATAGTTAAAVTAGYVISSSADAAATGEAVAAWTPMAPSGAAYLHIVAHPDDDLYFFNPDLEQAIKSGAAVTSVVVTAAEDDGKNLPRYDPGYAAAPVNVPDYISARTHGLRAAYALMATGDRTSPWQREAFQTRDGASAELATLTAAPRIKLVFLYLQSIDAKRPGATLVGELWEGTMASVATLVPAGSPVTTASSYTADDLQGTLLDLIKRFKPTVVRTMDPDPEQVTKDPRFPGTGMGDYADHGDHTAIGLFAARAVQQYQELAGDSRLLQESYRGYANERWPHALSGPAYQRKLTYLAVYGGADGFKCDDPAGCGDLKVGADAPTIAFGKSTTYRYPGTTTWLRMGPDGRLAAFAVLGGQAVMWTETAPGSGKWSGPAWLAGRPMASHVTPVLTKDGRWQLFGVALTLAGAPGDEYRPVMTSVQSAPGSTKFSAWASIGTPNFDAPQRRSLGAPMAALGGDGQLRVFVRNWGWGMSGCQQGPDGVWGGWADLGGVNIQDGFFCIDRSGEAIEMFAATDTTVAHWKPAPGQSWLKAGSLPVVAPAGAVTATKTSDGRGVVVVRQPDTSWVVAYQETTPGGDWDPTPVQLGGHGGFGPVASVTQKDHLVLAQRNDAGTVSVAWAQLTADKAPTLPPWTASGPLIVHMPALALDHDGQAVAACLGPNGKLFVARQKSGVRTMGAWKPAG
jgi:LmbE family N-acetylglucosaminyl deacetylase